MKKTILIVGFLFSILTATAQQDPQYTQYMYNMTVFAHLPVNKKVELGFSLISDDIGDGAKKENNFFADFAYVLPLQNNHKLSLGLKAGFSSLQTNFNGFKFESTSTDFAFDNSNLLKPNVGVGAYYFTNKYYVGLSAPNLLNTKHIEKRAGISDYGSANVLYNDKLELGASYRLGDAVSILMNVKATSNIRVGYAYDYTVSNLGQFNSGTHEFFILFNLDLLGKGYDKSPRFF